MRARTLAVLAAVTAVAVIAAFAVQRGRATAPASVAGAGEPAIPGLYGKADQAAQIVVQRPEGGFTLAKKGEGWVLADRGDFPAKSDPARQALAALAAMKLAEAKTARAERLARLELEDVAVKGAKSTLVTVKNAAGGEMGKLLIGKLRPESAGEPKSAVYVRRPGEGRAWLADADPKIKPELSDWVDRNVVELKNERMREAITVAPDGTKLAVARAKADDKDYKIQDLGEGLKPKSQYTVNDVAELPGALLIDDARPAASIPFPQQPARAEYRTFDGLVLRISVADHQGAKWIKLEAATENVIKSEDGKTTATPPADAVKDEAKKINDRLGGFAVRIAEGLAKRIESRLADLTEKEDKKP